MPYQRGGRDYGPSSTGGTTKYSSRPQVSVGVPDRHSRKPVQVRPAKPAKKDPGVAGVSGGLTGRGQAALTSTPAKPDPGVMGTRGGLTGRGQAPMTAQPAKADPGVMGTPGGSTGRGQNNPARTDPHVMGVPGGVTGRQPSTSRMTSATEPSDSEISFGPMRPKSLDPYLSFNGTPRTQPVPASNKYGLTFNGPINSLPWASDRLPLASSLTRGLSPTSRGFTSPPLTPEEQQELAHFRQIREAFSRGETIARNPWELNTRSRSPGSSPNQSRLNSNNVVDKGLGSHLSRRATPVLEKEPKLGTSYKSTPPRSQNSLNGWMDLPDVNLPSLDPPPAKPQRFDPGVLGVTSGVQGRGHEGGLVEDLLQREYRRYDFDPNGPTDFSNLKSSFSEAIGAFVRAVDQELRMQWNFWGQNPRRDNTPQNAHKHAAWSYATTLDLGPEAAKRMTDGHERGSPHPWRVVMDLHNNAVGRRLALNPANHDEPMYSVISSAQPSAGNNNNLGARDHDKLMTSPPTYIDEIEKRLNEFYLRRSGGA